jgi:hypothetical protein
VFMPARGPGPAPEGLCPAAAVSMLLMCLLGCTVRGVLLTAAVCSSLPVCLLGVAPAAAAGAFPGDAGVGAAVC